MLQAIYSLLIISLAVSVISMTVTKAVVFKKMRAKIKERNAFIGELFSCPFCFSFYVTAALVPFVRLKLLFAINFMPYFMPVDLLLSALCIVGFSSFFSGLIFNSLKNIP